MGWWDAEDINVQILNTNLKCWTIYYKTGHCELQVLVATCNYILDVDFETVRVLTNFKECKDLLALLFSLFPLTTKWTN